MSTELTTPGVLLRRDWFDPTTAGVIGGARQVHFRPCPAFLGNFQFAMFGDVYGRYHGALPPGLHHLAKRMAALYPQEEFNAAFVQRYDLGAYVKAHKDPMNNLNRTLIAIFGDFEGAETTVGGEKFTARPGDLVELPCTVNGVRGPRHQVSPVTSGCRYALILNTIL